MPVENIMFNPSLVNYEEHSDHECSWSGFGISVSGMNITVASGSMCGMSFASGSYTAVAPASGERCFGVFLKSNGTQQGEQDSSFTPCVTVIHKLAWVYVAAGDTTLEGKSISRYAPE
jgi:hypothetical protein